VGGRIWVEPNGGQGSVFSVEIPAVADRDLTHMGQKSVSSS
jgi:signal transduction histidine kinase